MEIPKGYSLSRCPFCGSDQLRMYPFKAGLDVDYKLQCYCLGAADGRTSEEAIGCWNDRASKAPAPPQPIYDEEKERELFEAVARDICMRVTGVWVPARYADGTYRNQTSQMLREAYIAGAQSRAKAGEDE